MSQRSLRELVSPPRTALVFVEAQRGVIGSESALPALADATIAGGAVKNMGEAARAARQAGVPVFHCTAEQLGGGFGASRNARLFAAMRRSPVANEVGGEAVRPIPEVGPEPGDIVLPRYHGLSPLTGGQLDFLLRNEGISTLVVAGVSVNVAVLNVVFDAVNRSYQVVVLSDAVAGVPPEYAEAVLQNTVSLVATLAATADVTEAWLADT